MVLARVSVHPSAAGAAHAAARLVAARARVAVQARGHFVLAVSGGATPGLMLSELAQLEVPWERIAVFQVDERVAPAGDAGRNLTDLEARLPDVARPSLRPMPVHEEDLETACRRYAGLLPQRLDLVHLGLGDDGHTASLVPGDPVLGAVDRDVAMTGPYRGHRRMTLTFPVLDRAREVLWLVTGADKAAALRLLRKGDPSIPAGRVACHAQTLVCDDAAWGGRAAGGSPQGPRDIHALPDEGSLH